MVETLQRRKSQGISFVIPSGRILEGGGWDRIINPEVRKRDEKTCIAITTEGQTSAVRLQSRAAGAELSVSSSYPVGWPYRKSPLNA